MKYRNKKTGQMVATTGRVSGTDWELAEEKKPKTAEIPRGSGNRPAGKKTGKSGGGEAP